MSVLAVVVAHTRRLHHVEELARKVGATHVFADDGTLGEWENHRRAIEWARVNAIAAGHEHICVVQDDALPVDRFREAVWAAALLRPDDMIGLYVGTLRPKREAVDAAVHEALKGAAWLSNKDLLWGVATMFPAKYAAEMLEWCKTSRKPYDLRLGRAWAAVRGEEKPVLYTWPSLVDHRDETSVVAGRPKVQGVRRARRTGWPFTWDVDVDRVVPIQDRVPRRGR